ncbi:hypothetical protein PTKIN_Ptkin09bG0131700 [Pterospermum kingtungense]
MAKIIFAPTFLFALLFLSYGIGFTEEVRLLKIEKADDGNQVTETMTSSRSKTNLRHGLYVADHDAVTASPKFTAFEHDSTDDVHPTNPGHSPGIGHSSTIPTAASNDHH